MNIFESIWQAMTPLDQTNAKIIFASYGQPIYGLVMTSSRIILFDTLELVLNLTRPNHALQRSVHVRCRAITIIINFSCFPAMTF